MALPVINVPMYNLVLPLSQKAITYRPFLVKEEKILLLALESQDDQSMLTAIKRIIQSCTNDTLDVENTNMADIEYMFAHLRAKSVGESAVIGLNCSECGTPNAVNISLDQVYIANKPESDIVKLSDTLALKMHYLTTKEIDDIADQYDNTVDQLYAIIVAGIDEIFYGDEHFSTNDHSQEEIQDFIDNLNADQFAAIKNFITNAPVATIDARFKCKECNHENDMQLRGLQNFFG